MYRKHQLIIFGHNIQLEKLREDTFKNFHGILKTRQFALAMIAIYDYFSKIKVLSNLWSARPKV